MKAKTLILASLMSGLFIAGEAAAELKLGYVNTQRIFRDAPVAQKAGKKLEGEFAKREPQANAAMMGTLAQWYAQGKVKPVIDRTMPMAELPAAYAHMGSRGVMGKLVMVN